MQQLSAQPPQLLYRPEAAARALDVSRSIVFELLADGRLESVKIGRSRRITKDALDAYVAGLAAPTSKDDGAPEVAAVLLRGDGSDAS